MDTISAEKQYTVDDLPAVENGDCFELVDGRLVEKHMGAEAGAIGANIIFLLRGFVRDHPLGRVFTQDAGYQLFPEDRRRLRKPDVSLIRNERLGDRPVPRGDVAMPPDLAVEVVSPTDLAEDVNARVVDYLRANVPLIWLVYPATRFVQVFGPGGRASYLFPADEITGEDVLPGFACRVEEFFAGI
jgi:Uma2 family endonuclease